MPTRATTIPKVPPTAASLQSKPLGEPMTSTVGPPGSIAVTVRANGRSSTDSVISDAPRFQDALELNARMGARPWLARTQCDYALMLLARDAPGDRERAHELVTSGAQLAEELGMTALTERLAQL